MAELELTNVITISVSEAESGAGEYNTSNLAIFSRETAAGSFGTDGYKIYLSPTDVAVDFGTSSETYKMSNAVFSQKPNILAGNGYLVVIPYEDDANVTEIQRIVFTSDPATGNYKLKYGAETTANIAANSNAATVQTALRLLTGLSSITVAGSEAAGFDITFTGVSGDASLLEAPVTGNSLQDAGGINVDLTITVTTPGTTASTETLDEAIVRTEGLVQYFGIMTAEITSEVNMDAAAATVQALNKIAFFVSRTEADINPGGMIDDLATAGYTKSRGLYYGGATDSSALKMMASYAGRALSVNFAGSNTTSTMHLKDLVGVDPDPTMTQTILEKALAAGADTYVSLQGVAKTFCSGANRFFDQVYNEQWFAGALQIAGFNYLAQSSTKVPQTEAGMYGLKGAYRNVCEQAITNQYGAPGTWNSSTTFGNQSDFLDNISQRGYYIYSTPVSQQSQADREDRVAPLIQIAFKEAGAIHSSSVIVVINP